MDKKEILERSIILLGPKYVGKTVIGEHLINEKESPNVLISSDLLTNLIVFDLSGRWNTVVKGSEIEEIGTLYKETFKFNELSQYVEQLAKIQHSNCPLKVKRVAQSYWKARLLEEALGQLHEPIILDAGADVGFVLNLDKDEKKQVESMLFMPYEFIEDRMNSFIKSFGMVCYVETGSNYAERCGRNYDEDNQLYIENPESYKKFANYNIDTDQIFNNGKNREENFKRECKKVASAYVRLQQQPEK